MQPTSEVMKKLNNEEIENLNKPIMSKKIESIIKTSQQMKAQDLTASLVISAKLLNKN